MLKKAKVAVLGLAVCAAALAAGRPAHAAFLFDPDGAGAQGPLSIVGFQPAVNSALANGGLTAIQNVGAGGTGSDVVGNQFILTYQSNLTGFLPNSQVDPGLNVNHQITVTLQMREYVTSVSADNRTFNFAVSSNQTGMAGLQMWANNAVTFDATGLNGTTYKPGSAVNILTAAATSSTSSNFVNSNTVSPLDQSPFGNAWGTTQTVNGAGGSVVRFTTSSVNASYFLEGLPPVLTLTFTGSQNTPFRTIHPAQTMWDGTATAALIGAVNGLPGGGGTSTIFEVNGSLAVPEPSSVILTTLGLCGSFVLVRKTRRQAV